MVYAIVNFLAGLLFCEIWLYNFIGACFSDFKCECTDLALTVKLVLEKAFDKDKRVFNTLIFLPSNATRDTYFT